MIDVDSFFKRVDARLTETRRRGSIGYVELSTHAPADVADLFVEEHHVELLSVINEAIDGAGVFCWYAGRFVVLLDEMSAAATRAVFVAIKRGIVERVWRFGDDDVHATPVIGYSDLILTGNARELWGMVEAALDQAKVSLEVDPVRYGRRLARADRVPARLNPIKLWRLTPQWAVLAVQFAVSLLLGLGAPFIFYAVCDALGFDISGPVYIGVVVVLVITAITIWIEGFLALKSTTPPLEPGLPYPKATIIIPAYLPNEAATIIETLNAFLKLEYANAVQIIVAYNSPFPRLPVEDEMEELARTCAQDGRFSIEPMRVSGSTSKAQNVNAVVSRVRGRFVGIFDADHHPQADSLERAWRWLSNGWDIVQGRCSIRNGGDSWIARMVAVEFEQIYAISHPGRARFHGFGIFGGSNGFWRTSVLHETRMRHSMLTEDIDSSIRAVVAGYRIAGDRDLVSEELAPTAIKQLLNQRLRWAQGWFQVSFRRVMPALLSPRVSVRQKLGLIHLLVWRELFPWYSIQVVPIMFYWIMVYGWSYLHWTIPVFLATTIFTMSTGPGQIALAYLLAHRPMKRKWRWFLEYLIVSTFFFSPFKDALSRVAHIKEAMGERAWKVTPRVAGASRKRGRGLAGASLTVLMLLHASLGSAVAQTVAPSRSRSTGDLIATLLGGEASTIAAARQAAHDGRNADAARLFAKAIDAVPRRRGELLREYADALLYGGMSARAVPLYREALASRGDQAERWAIAARLALALSWSGQNEAALAMYDRLAAHDPAS
ncbi:glycosyltransferase family 2 protein, partial [Sphingomonas bacterium]|uniref:glycosyltransferase family 2 protein n=1 Tax=Sphingomonas bacterium TaxID=1895847 RepID=UPI001576B341